MTRDYVATARAYEAGVIAGEIPVCQWVRLACERNHRDRRQAESPAFPYRFDEERAVVVCRAVEQFPHIKGSQWAKQHLVDGEMSWNRLHLEPWQCWILTTVFGWLREDGLRRFRTALILVPRKNAKSTMSAAVALYMLTADGESGAEIYSAATTRDQAKIVAELARDMAKRSPAFREFFGVKIGSNQARPTVAVDETASRLEPLSADAHTLDGLNVHCAVVDELHAHKNRQVWDVLETATGARQQPLLWAISTAGSDVAGICYEQVAYLQKILQQVVVDETYFGVNYTVDEGDDWQSPKTWQRANPNYGVSVRPDDLERKANKASHSPAAVNNFLTKHLNVWVKEAASWMPLDDWHACADSSITLESLKRYPCWIGVDLAEVRDIAALVALFRLPGHRYAALGRFYLPQDTIDRSPVAQYPGWVRSGDLIPTEGGATDYARIEDDILAWCSELDVQLVCFDRALAAQMGQQLERKLGRRPHVITVPQGVEVLNPVMQSVMAAVIEKRFMYSGDPVFAWAASNIVVQLNHKSELYPRKAGGKDSHHKIDPMSALFTAWSQAMLVPDGPARRRRSVPLLWTKDGWVPA